MPNKIYIFISIILLFFNNDNIIIEKRIKIICDFLTIDKIGNIYCVRNNTITKIDNNGKILGKFSGSLHEGITCIDAGDPFKIMLFQKDINKIFFLNNKLSRIGIEINLYDFDIYETAATCKSADGGFWLIDSEKKVLCKFNSLFRLDFEKQLFNIEQNTVTGMKETEDKLYIDTKQNGIHIFDLLGNKITKLLLNTNGNFQVIDNSVIYFDKSESELVKFNITDKDSEKINIPKSLLCLDAICIENKLFLTTSEEIIIAKQIIDN